MILSVSGEAKTGKTTFAYTAPGKVVGFSFDIGAKRALYGVKYEQFKDKSIHIEEWVAPKLKPAVGTPFRDEVLTRRCWDEFDITIYEFPQNVQMTEHMIGAREQWQTFLVLYQTALMDPAVRTVVLDTASLARRAAADAWLQELQENEPVAAKKRKQLLQIEWGKPNGAVKSLYDLARATGKNLVVIHHLRDEYRGDNATGNREVEGIKDGERLWDVGIRSKTDNKNVVSFKYDVCGYNLGLQNSPVAGDNWNSMVEQIDNSLGGRLELERA